MADQKISAASDRAVNRVVEAAKKQAFIGSYTGGDEAAMEYVAGIEDEYEQSILALKDRITKLEGERDMLRTFQVTHMGIFDAKCREANATAFERDRLRKELPKVELVAGFYAHFPGQEQTAMARRARELQAFAVEAMKRKD